MQIEVGKEYRTRDGRKATVIGCFSRGTYPFHGKIGEKILPVTWRNDGGFGPNPCDPHDLIALWEESDAPDGDKVIHASCCARHNPPAYPAGPCDCGCDDEPLPILSKEQQERKSAGLREYLKELQGYVPLENVLGEAAQQAAYGKGKERHANGKPFLEQPIMTIGRNRGLGFTLGQADKKTQEAAGMVARGEHDLAVEELLGAINYIAAAIIHIREIAK